jgi:hypothetical protein
MLVGDLPGSCHFSGEGCPVNRREKAGELSERAPDQRT